jgi:hypothetical protein
MKQKALDSMGGNEMRFGIRGLVTKLVLSVFACTIGAAASTAHAPASLTRVEIKSEHLTGILPDGGSVVIRMKVVAEGVDGSLAGEGRHFGSNGGHSYWPVTGVTDGVTVTLTGAVSDSNGPLIGSPVSISADVSTEAITMHFGPLTGGRFAGQTLLFEGLGKVSIRRE